MKKTTDYLKTQENWYILKCFKKKKHNVQMNRNINSDTWVNPKLIRNSIDISKTLMKEKAKIPGEFHSRVLALT